MSERGESMDLEAIKARCEAATPGPWLEFMYWVEDKTRYAICGDVGSDDNRVFIALARTDIPALIAEVEHLRRGLELARDEYRAREAEVERLQERDTKTQQLLLEADCRELRAISAAVAAEREACARIAEQQACMLAAHAIRARGNQ